MDAEICFMGRGWGTWSLSQMLQCQWFLMFRKCTLCYVMLQISRLEQLKTDLTTLFALCEKADNDIRSCINTLQVHFWLFHWIFWNVETLYFYILVLKEEHLLYTKMKFIFSYLRIRTLDLNLWQQLMQLFAYDGRVWWVLKC